MSDLPRRMPRQTRRLLHFTAAGLILGASFLEGEHRSAVVESDNPVWACWGAFRVDVLPPERRGCLYSPSLPFYNQCCAFCFHVKQWYKEMLWNDWTIMSRFRNISMVSTKIVSVVVSPLSLLCSFISANIERLRDSSRQWQGVSASLRSLGTWAFEETLQRRWRASALWTLKCWCDHGRWPNEEENRGLRPGGQDLGMCPLRHRRHWTRC